ncbi:DUF3006 domain-containing protein [Amphibacillus sp. Q70]|uniref:DUF3006 domain-containing protein n=1 Tax=Amphibacillus sp. Q70 TaxID=3453416 RepID=UPI003F84B0B3
MKVEAVIDRFTEQRQAVVLAETIGKEFFIDQAKLPEGAVRGDYLNLELDKNDQVVNIVINQEKTMERKKSVQAKLAQLRQKSTGSKFRRD